MAKQPEAKTGNIHLKPATALLFSRFRPQKQSEKVGSKSEAIPNEHYKAASHLPGQLR